MFSTNSDESDESKPRNMDLSDRGPCGRRLFAQRSSKSATNTCSSSQSDSSAPAGARFRTKKSKGNVRRLPPLGLFWDIENVSVPKMKSASVVVQKLREVFLKKYRESEFVVVCDVKKENPQIIQELHDSQVDLLHVSSSSKNAADEKLRQSLRRYAELHPAPSAVVLISGDVNFAGDLSDLRYRKKLRVILVHNVNVADALILCAHEHHSFAELTEHLPATRKSKEAATAFYLSVLNVPKHVDSVKVKTRLKSLSYNCGGKCVQYVTGEGVACLRFGNFDLALRAQKRIQGEDVFGNKIKVLSPSVRCYSGKKVKSVGQSTPFVAAAQPAPPPPPGFTSEGVVTMDSCQQQQASTSRNACKPILGRPCTPQEPFFKRVHTFSGSSDQSDGSLRPVDLNITNLDPAIEPKELRNLLAAMIKEYAMILSLSVSQQADGAPVAHLRVGSQQEARFVISKLHRQKLGHKRITVSYVEQSNQPDPDQLKAMTVSILQEAPDQSMPLFKFMDLLESRFHCTVSVSDVNRLKDVARIADRLGSRVISLTKEVKVSPPPTLSTTMVPFCTIHCPDGLRGSRGWCEEFNTSQVPNVQVSLGNFASALMRLLDVHLGSMPLLSFQACYEQEFRVALPVDDDGVPLEHLVTCVPRAELLLVGPNRNIKIVTARPESGDEGVARAATVAAPLAPNVNLLCREIVDLLKTADRCQLPLTKFIPAYHHHFGRQCRVADYGFTKLLDLIESVSHVVQIMGEGTRRVITLTHPAQMRRFTSDLLRVLKAQPAKQIAAVDFPAAYEKVTGRRFDPAEYGLCTFVDLLREMGENTLVLRETCDGLMIAVPKREQTAEEAARTKQFAREAVDLLKHTPYYTMLFNKFVPAYHHHFGHQCRVSDYGFVKLVELFEAIPDVVKIEELPDGERTVSLTARESLKTLGAQVQELIGQDSVTVDELAQRHFREFGYPLKPSAFGCSTLFDLVLLLSDYVEVVDCNRLRAIPQATPTVLGVRCWGLLLDPPHCKELAVLRAEYRDFYRGRFSRETLLQASEMVSMSTSASEGVEYALLTAIYTLAAQLFHVIRTNGGRVPFNRLERLYGHAYGKPLRLATYQIRGEYDFRRRLGLVFHVAADPDLGTVVALGGTVAEHLEPILNARDAKKFSPPKPDTPPTPSSSWSQWASVPGNSNAVASNLSINMPISHHPRLLGDTHHLVSPARHLLLADPWRGSPPHPSQLPLPDKFLGTSSAPPTVADDSRDESTDSGVNTRLDNSDEPPRMRTPELWRSYLEFQ
ncbi:meiosis regulator and mRNA stability factor 1 isoform X2 [Cylas formicarius]|uniref:meiosis regulator and mRNA stability factor 1 isoform X2 n=1 Tax=Cylas formicarius TaxID=197179 RepID=UPI0029589486|nr:meiosis regulator and mRNA stability factor 1 isoform X2 [Cylas formicarius]